MYEPEALLFVTQNMAAYRVPTQNRFAQLDSDVESDFDKHVIPPKKVVDEIPVNLAATETSQRPVRSFKESKPSAATRATNQQGAAAFSPRGGRGYGRGLRSGAPRTFNNQPKVGGDAPAGFDNEVVHDETGKDTRRPVRFNKGRSERGGRNTSLRGREYERRSGTGRGKEMKKSGAGGHNWGTPEGGFDVIAPRSEEEGTGELYQNTDVVLLLFFVFVDESPINAESTEEKAPDSSPETDKQQKLKENKSVDFSEWQKTQKQKRQVLLQEKLVDVTNTDPVRSVNAAELEEDGYRLYEREPIEENRPSRDARYHQASEDEDEDGEVRRPKTVRVYF